jgi:hypothetical protein
MIDLYLNSQKKPVMRNHDILLITGDGKTLLADLEHFLEQKMPHDVLCMGRSIQKYPGFVDHYVDVDSDAGAWVLENLEKNHPDKVGPDGILTHTLGHVEWVDCDWDIKHCPWDMADVMWHGSSALFSVLIGLQMGYRRIYLAGCPLDSKGHWYFPEEDYGPRWTMETYQAWFEFAKTPDAKKVRSLSGYTGQLLGSYFHVD